MSSVISRLRSLWHNRAGVAAMEFGLIAIPLFFIIIATTDLGRYFLTQHSVRTLTAEAGRTVMVSCFNATAPCSLTSAQSTAVKARTPFLIPTRTALSATQAARASGNDVRTITVTATYPFTFIFNLWSGLSGDITETTTMTY